MKQRIASLNIRQPVQLLLLLLYLLDAGPMLAGQELSCGRIIEKVSCRNDPAQTYALYLPSYYTPDKKWPILFALDPGARGNVPVELFKNAAEEYGYILAGSNNSRNGPLKVVEDAVNAIMADAGLRFPLNPQRVYLAGFSGGARAAILTGFASTGRIAGIVACGAGFPPSIRPAAPVPFALYITVGWEDFYFPELRELDRTLSGLGVIHELETFSGGHTWPPESVCRHALEWLEIQAMKSGRRDKDMRLIDRIYARTIEEAAACEKSLDLSASWERYASAARSFAGLRVVAVLGSKVEQLEASGSVRKARSLEKKAEARQKSTDGELSRFLSDAISGNDRALAMQQLASRISGLRKDAAQKKDEVSRVAAVRVLTRFWIMSSEEATADFEHHEYGAAALRLNVMTRIRPDNPQPYFHLARACSLSGRKKEAIMALRNAVARGFKDIEALQNNRDLEPLRMEPDFQKILESLKKPPLRPSTSRAQRSGILKSL